MKEYIEFIVKSLVKNPNEVTIEEEKDGSVLRIKICAHTDDMGTIIGKGGSTIRSIRELAKAKAIIDDIKVYVDVC